MFLYETDLEKALEARRLLTTYEEARSRSRDLTRAARVANREADKINRRLRKMMRG